MVYLLRDVIESAGTNRKAIRDAIAAVGRSAPAFVGVTGKIAFDENGDVPEQRVIIGIVQEATFSPRGPVKLSHSLRRLIGVMMAALMVLVLAMTVLGAWSIRSISRTVETDMQTVQTGAEIANALVTSVLGEIRAAEHYLLNPSPEVKEEFVANGDSAYSYQARYRELKTLSNADRRIVNEIGANQATLEVAYATAHALSDIGKPDQARAIAARASGATDSLVADVRRLSDAQAEQALNRAQALRTARPAATRRWSFCCASSRLWLAPAPPPGPCEKWTGSSTGSIAAADRFGAGDLRAIQLSDMPQELARLARALDNMAGQLRGVVAAVVKESSHLGASAGDFSAMSEEIAASSGQISAAMVKISAGAEQQRHGMSEADQLLAALRSGAATNAEAAGRVVRLGEEIRRVSSRHHADVETARRTLLDVREVVTTSAQQVRALAARSEQITSVHRPDQADLLADQPSGAERRHRGGPGGRARPRLRGGGGRGPSARGLQRPGSRGSDQDRRIHPHSGAGSVRDDAGGHQQGQRNRTCRRSSGERLRGDRQGHR